jgi:uncharacterized protein (TIGR02266 family)
MLEQRADARHEIYVDVVIGGDSHFYAGLSGDVSRGGIFVATYAPLPVGTPVQVKFVLPDGELALEGTVRWIRAGSERVSPGLGIRFENLEAVSLVLIERFCREQPPLYVDDEE